VTDPGTFATPEGRQDQRRKNPRLARAHSLFATDKRARAALDLAADASAVAKMAKEQAKAAQGVRRLALTALVLAVLSGAGVLALWLTR